MGFPAGSACRRWQHPRRRSDLAEDKTYSATYVGSGTFLISKPKRKRAKLRQSRVKSPQRGARK